MVKHWKQISRLTLVSAVFVLLPFVAACGESEEQAIAWVRDFFLKGIKSAHAEYVFATETTSETSDHYHKEERVEVDFVFSEKRYHYRYDFDYRDNWSVLTNSGAEQPPRQEPRFTGSKITPWTNDQGLGIYHETYERTLPNWLNFENLDSLMFWQVELNNPRPALSGIFFGDEIKSLKKLYKELPENELIADLLDCFEFDHEGNLLELSRVWLDDCNPSENNRKKGIAESTILIRNNEEDALFLDVLTHEDSNSFIEGAKLTWNHKSCRVFSFELNTLLHKFVPDIASDPQVLISNYLVELNSYSAKPFGRFEITASK